MRRFLALSNAGDATDRGMPRSSCDENLDEIEFLRLAGRGKFIDPPGTPPQVEIDPPRPLEDMPWTTHEHIVSERFRLFLEEEAPGHAQFFEVQMRGPKRLLPSQPYYLVNWLHVVDCIDFDASEWKLGRLPGRPVGQNWRGEPYYSFTRVIIDPRKVPDSIMIFRLKHQEVEVAIDTRLAEKIKRVGITGPQFYDISYSYLDEF